MNKSWKRTIILFLTSQTISLFGSSLVQYAIMWYITLKTQSGVMMTISIICGFLPTFFLSPFAGVWADRYHRKTLIMLSDAMIAVTTLLLGILFLLGFKAMWLLFVASAVRSVGTAIQTPAVNAFLPQLVPEDKLTKVNATNGSIQAFIMLISPMASGALLTFASIEAVFFIDVVTAVLAVLTLLFFLQVPSHAKASEKQKIGYFSDLRDGFHYIKSHSFLKPFFLFQAVFCFLAAPVAFLTPLQVTRFYGDEVWRLTAIEIVFSIGMMGGGMLIASLGGFKNRVHTMTLSSLMIGAGTVLLGLMTNFWVYLAMMVVVGLAMPIYNTPATVLLQEKVEGDFLGRVFGVMMMVSSVMMPMGMLLFGPLSDTVKIEWMLVVTGILMFIEGLILVSNKVLIQAGKPVPKPEQ